MGLSPRADCSGRGGRRGPSQLPTQGILTPTAHSSVSLEGLVPEGRIQRLGSAQLDAWILAMLTPLGAETVTGENKANSTLDLFLLL